MRTTMSQFVETCTKCNGTGAACNHDFHILGEPGGQVTQCPSCRRTDAGICPECQGQGEVWIDDPIK